MKRLVILLCIFVALAPAATDTTSFVVPIDSTLFFGSETVVFSGNVHIVTTRTDPIHPSDPMALSVHMNLQGVSGIGATSGLTYRAVGAAMVETETLPGLLTVIGSGFQAIPPNPQLPQDPMRAVVRLSINGQVSVIEAHLEADFT